MSVLLLDAVIAHIRGLFTSREVAEVRPYAGEFNAAEVDRLTFNAPAVLVAVLGWKPVRSGGRMTGRHVRAVRMAAFVVTKDLRDRETRMRAAAVISERLSVELREWSPASTEAIQIGPLDEDPAAENLYGQAIDKAGLALWMVSWTQAVRPLLAPPQMWDLLSIEIVDHTHQGTVPANTAPTGTLSVTEDVLFKPL